MQYMFYYILQRKIQIYSKKKFEDTTLQCNNCNERAIIDVLLHACMEHLKLLEEKNLTSV